MVRGSVVLGAANSQAHSPPVDLYWFFEISTRTEKEIQLVYTEIFFQFLLKFFSSSNLELKKDFSENWRKKSVSL